MACLAGGGQVFGAHIPSVPVDVIHFLGRHEQAFGQARLAQRVAPQLGRADFVAPAALVIRSALAAVAAVRVGGRAVPTAAAALR
jgi:hypothetical protein